jgi:hypothetical protein
MDAADHWIDTPAAQGNDAEDLINLRWVILVGGICERLAHED